MLTEDERQRIAGSGIFQGIAFNVIAPFTGAWQRRELAVGEALLVPHQANNFLFVVLSGELRVYLGSRDLPEHTVLSVGDCAGEMSLIDGQSPSAEVIAAMETTVLAIPHDTVWAMVDAAGTLARNLLSILAGRLRRDNLALVTSRNQALEFEDAAAVDTLTGLHNRRWMNDTFPRTLQRCERDVAPLCLILAEIDDFKRFNDLHGHLVGDTVLRMVARCIAEGLRPQDMVARCGSAAFALMLPQANNEVGMRVTERVRNTVANLRFKVANTEVEEAVTLTCGIAPFRLGDTMDGLMGIAEAALAEAHETGSNCIVLSPDRA